MRIIKMMVLAMLMSFGLNASNSLIEKGREAYLAGNRAEAYKCYTEFLFTYGSRCDAAEYYIALSGRMACMESLKVAKMIEIERSFFDLWIDGEVTDFESSILDHVFRDGVYRDYILEKQKNKKP